MVFFDLPVKTARDRREASQFRKFLLNDGYHMIQFEGELFPAVNKYDKYLVAAYGNYRELPPPEQRVWQHHPLVLDFSHPYSDTTGQFNQKQ